jgi:tetratricopeptide (TPR) repeat protein
MQGFDIIRFTQKATHRTREDIMIARETITRLGRRSCVIGLSLLTALVVLGQTGQAGAAEAAKSGERFEITSIKAVRPTLVNTVAALQRRDIAGAKTAFEAYDSLWNGIEMYVNTRSKDMYDTLEHVLQARIEKALDAPNPDVSMLLADAQAMLVKYDEAIDMVSKAAPLNPLYDDIARLRIVRAHLREVVPALKAGNFDKARKSFAAFDSAWDSIEDMIKAHSADDYVAIEKGMIEIEKALMPEKPDVAEATALVNGVMAKYNVTVTELVKEARSRP